MAIKEDYRDYLIIDTKSGECIDIEKLTNLDTEEVIVKKREEEIIDWIDDGETVFCPSIDAVIGESSGFPITTEFLEKMRDYWF